MLTKGKNSKFRAVKYVAMVLALVAVLAFAFTSCGQAKVLSAEYLAGTLEKSQYNAGETFDCTGAQMKVTYDDGSVETVAVESTMVGEVKLEFGMANVEATYSKDGQQIKCLIPVTVIDPLAGDKSEAIAAINAKDSVKNGDKGVAAMVAEYTNKINAAATKAGITELAAAFDTELADYTAAKAAALARVEDADLTGLYEQFLLDVQNAQKLAVSNIKAAISKEEAADIADGFEDLIEKKLAEQSFYEKDEVGQIDQKIEIIKTINKYIAKAENYIALIYHYNTTIGQDQQDMIDGYTDAITALDLLKEEVRLAINLTKIQKDLDDIIVKLLTPVDGIYDLIKDGHVVKPAPYKADGVTLETVVANDPTKDLLAKYDALYAEALTKFGSEDLVKDLAEDYQYGESASDKLNLLDLFATIKTKRDDLDKKQAAIATLNATVATWAGENAVKPSANDIIAAWKTLGEWAEKVITSESVVDTAATKAIIFDAVPYDAASGKEAESFYGAFEIVYITTENDTNADMGYEDTYKVNEWSDSYVDAAYLTGYFFPALDALKNATATAAESVKDVTAKVGNIAPIVLTHDENVDAGSRIATAKSAYDNYIAIYKVEFAGKADADLTHLENSVKVLYETLTKAEADYQKLVDLAESVNTLISALGEAKDIAIKDYDAVDGKLKAAYDEYFKFVAANQATIEIDGVETKYGPYTDVIADVDGNIETTDDQNEAHLLACMKHYVELKFTDEVRIQGDLTITAAYMKAMSVTSKDTDTLFRAALLDKKNALLGDLPSFAEDYKLELNGEAVVETLDNILDILDANLAASQLIADDLAEQFIAFYNAEKDASMPEYDSI